MEKSIINCTNHTVQFLNDKNETLFELESNPIPARVKYEITPVGFINYNGYTLTETKTKPTIIDLPPPKEGVLYVVSKKVKLASDRDDLRVPSEVIRDGTILGCKYLGL